MNDLVDLVKSNLKLIKLILNNFFKKNKTTDIINLWLTSQANNSHQNTTMRGSSISQILGLLLNGHEFKLSHNH